MPPVFFKSCVFSNWLDVNTEKGTNVYIFSKAFKITPTSVFFPKWFLWVTLHLMFILIIEDLGTKLQVSVLEVPIIDYCLAFSVVIACLSFPLIFKLLEGSDQLCITDLFIPMYSTLCDK